MITSHYAEPMEREIASATPLWTSPRDSANIIRKLQSGDVFAMLDDSIGWAWGYAGADRRVGYVKSDSVAAR